MISANHMTYGVGHTDVTGGKLKYMYSLTNLYTTELHIIIEKLMASA